MTGNEIKSIDARTFPEIWSGLTKTEQNELRTNIVAKLGCTTASVCNYASGKSVPFSKPGRAAVAAAVEKITGKRNPPELLFPGR